MGADGTISWLIESLDAEASATVSLVATTGEPGEIVNTSTVDSDEGATATAQATTLVTRSDLAITKTVDNPSPLLGQQTVFTIAVTNNGNAVASNISVVDPLPAEIGSVVADPEATLAEDGSLQWTIAAIEPGGHGNHNRYRNPLGGRRHHQYRIRNRARRDRDRRSQHRRAGAHGQPGQGRRFGPVRGR